ncbi:MAG: response regulator [Myxococcota bacterium]
MADKKKPIGSILLRQRAVSSKQLAQALKNQRRGDPPLVSRLTAVGVITKKQALKALSEQTGSPGIDLDQVVIRLDDLALVPRPLAERHNLIPVLVKGPRMFVAMADPTDRAVVQELEVVTGKRVFPYVALKAILRGVIDTAYDRREEGRRHFVGADCSDETLRKAGVDAADAATRPRAVVRDQQESASRTASASPATRGLPPPPPAPRVGSARGVRPVAVDEAPSVQMERRLRPLSQAMVAEQPVVLDDRMEQAAEESNPDDLLFDDPSFGDDGARADDALSPVDVVVAEEDDEDVAPAPKTPSGVATSEPILLVIDTDPDIRSLVHGVFTERGFKVAEAHRGDEVLRKVGDLGPTVIVLDATLPGVHGFEVARELKSSERYRDIRIVMMSDLYRGWRIAEDLKSNYGIDGFIEKPFRSDDIVRAVDLALRTGGRPSVPPGVGEKSEPFLQAGIAAYKEGRPDEAMDHLRRGVEAEPLAYKVHFHLGLLYGKSGHLYDGIQHLETALTIRSNFYPALKNLAVLYQNAGFRNKAIEMWERCLSASPDEGTREQIKRNLMAIL